MSQTLISILDPDLKAALQKPWDLTPTGISEQTYLSSVAPKNVKWFFHPHT